VRLLYPAAVPERDFTARPRAGASGTATLRVGGRHRTVRIRHGRATLHASRTQSIRVLSGRDGLGNRLP
jgi:hypothetical protein